MRKGGLITVLMALFWGGMMQAGCAATSVPSSDPDYSIELKRTSVRAGFVTFGDVFPPGELRPSHQLGAELNGQNYPLQMDVKATHTDGSVRHAIFTLAVPEGRGQLKGSYGLLENRSVDLRWNDTLFDGMILQLEGSLGDGRLASYRLPVGALLSEGEEWLSGPMAVERIASLEVGPLLKVWISGRQYRDGSGRIRLSFENHKTFSPVPRDLSYRVSLSNGSDYLFKEDIPLHYRHAGWTHEIWLGGETVAELMPPLKRWAAAGAIPPYEKGLLPREDAERWKEGPVLPGEHKPLVQYMPTTGSRKDIGPLTHWAARWLMTGSPAARKEMLRLANIGLTIPWHFEEDNTGLPVRADERPRFWSEERGIRGHYDHFPASSLTGKDGGWTTDLSHRPELAYPAYLATGEAVYMRALAHEGAFAIHNIWPDKRGPSGVLVVRHLQLRASAWSLRTVSNAAYLLPDNHPLKEYFVTVRNENLNHLYGRYVLDGEMQGAGEVEGWFADILTRGKIPYPAWQGDFLTIVLAQEVTRRTPLSKDLLDWAARFTVGRVNYLGSLEVMAGQRTIVHGADGRLLNSWEAIALATRRAFPDGTAYTGNHGGGYSVLRAALGAIVFATGDEQAASALDRLRRMPGASDLYNPTKYNGRLYAVQFNLD